MKTKIVQFGVTLLVGVCTLGANAQNDWHITGNSNTGQSNFIGTTVLQPLIFKTNSRERMRLTKYGQLGFRTITPQYTIDVRNDTFYNGINVINTYPSLSDHVGVYSSSVIADGWGYGIQAYGGFNGTLSQCNGGAYTGSGIGISGVSYGSAGTRYGVYGYAFGGSFNAAGYFAGDVYAVNYYFFAADRKF